MLRDVAVVGGGIIGSAIAHELSAAGLAVAVFDEADWRGKASVAASGLLIAGRDGLGSGSSRRASAESLRLYPAWVAEIERQAGMSVYYAGNSVLRAAADETEERRLRGVLDRAQQVGWAGEWVGPEELSEILGSASPFRGAIRFLLEGTVAPGKLLCALRLGCVAMGAVWEDGAVCEIEYIRGKWQVATSTTRVRAGELVLACGYRTAQWADRLGFPLPLQPIRGSAYRVASSSAAAAAVVVGSTHAVFQPEGGVVVGSTVEKGETVPVISPSALARLRKRSLAAFPWLQQKPVTEVLCGIRPGSGTGHPVVARVPQRSGVLVACGHYRSGFALAPLTGRVAREIVLGTPLSDAARYFAFPGR